MAITEKTVTVDGVDYFIQAFGATKGIRLFQKVAKLIGPAFQTIVNSAQSQDDAVGMAISKLLESMDEVELDVLLKDLMSCVTKDKKALAFEVEFMADYGKLVALTREVISLNWGSLFQSLGTPEE